MAFPALMAFLVYGSAREDNKKQTAACEPQWLSNCLCNGSALRARPDHFL